MNNAEVLTIFYDGACGVCATEMEHYRSMAGQHMEFIDISADDFHPEDYDKSIADFQRELHVRDALGNYHTGVDAFRLLWKKLPAPLYPFLAIVTGLPGVKQILGIGYSMFAKVRHLLPKSRSCQIPERNQEDKYSG